MSPPEELPLFPPPLFPSGDGGGVLLDSAGGDDVGGDGDGAGRGSLEGGGLCLKLKVGAASVVSEVGLAKEDVEDNFRADGDKLSPETNKVGVAAA